MPQSFEGVRVLFFVPGANVLTYGTFASQIFGMARALIGFGAKCAILHKSPGASSKVLTLENGILLFNVTTEDPEYKIWRIATRYEKVINAFSEEILAFAPTHIYTREYGCELGALRFCRNNGIKLVYSMRGPDAYERRNKGGLRNMLASLFMHRDVRMAVESSDAFTTLSNNFVAWCEKKYGRKGIMIPCCVADDFFGSIPEQRRQSVRQNLGFASQDKVIVWCGNVAYWQILDDVVLFLKRLTGVDDTVRCLFIANNPAKMRHYCERARMDEARYRILKVDPREIPAYLQACDAGIDLLKVGDFKSSICCPIKVGEYLASGLPVIISRTMGDFPDIVSQSNTGIVIGAGMSDRYVMDRLDLLMDSPRKTRIDIAQKFFGWHSYKKELLKLFQ